MNKQVRRGVEILRRRYYQALRRNRLSPTQQIIRPAEVLMIR